MRSACPLRASVPSPCHDGAVNITQAMLHDLIAGLPRQAPAAAVLALFVTAIAYTPAARLKVLIMSIPVPFTCAYLATDIPVDSTHLSAFGLIVLYHMVVYALHARIRLPLGVAIATGIALYLALGVALRPLRAVPLPWVAAVLLLGWVLWLRRYRPRPDPDFRSRAPIWIKLPGVFAIAIVIMNFVPLLAGAAVSFPFASVFTSYEMRHSLRTLTGQFPINVIGVGALVCTIWCLQGRLPAPWPLLLGWLPAMLALLLINRLHRVRPVEGLS